MLRWMFFLLIASVLSAALMRLIAKFALRRIGGVTVHRLTPSGGMFWAVIFLALGMGGMVYVTSLLSDVPAPVIWVVRIIYAAAALVLGAVVFFYQVYWTVEGIGSWDPWRGSRFLRWDDVIEIKTLWRLPVTGVRDRRGMVIYSSWFEGAGELDSFLARRAFPARPA